MNISNKIKLKTYLNYSKSQLKYALKNNQSTEITFWQQKILEIETEIANTDIE